MPVLMDHHREEIISAALFRQKGKVVVVHKNIAFHNFHIFIGITTVVTNTENLSHSESRVRKVVVPCRRFVDGKYAIQ